MAWILGLITFDAIIVVITNPENKRTIASKKSIFSRFTKIK